MPPTPRPRTTAQVLKQQAEDTERNRPKPAAAPADKPTSPASTTVALASSTALVAPDNALRPRALSR
jgi:hypothetical protein